MRDYLRLQLSVENIDFERLTNAINELIRETSPTDEEVRQLIQKQNELMEAMNNLAEALAKTPPAAQQVLLQKMEEYSRELENIKAQLSKTGQRKEVTIEQVKGVYRRFYEKLDSEVEEVARAFIAKITVTKRRYVHITPRAFVASAVQSMVN